MMAPLTRMRGGEAVSRAPALERRLLRAAHHAGRIDHRRSLAVLATGFGNPGVPHLFGAADR